MKVPGSNPGGGSKNEIKIGNYRHHKGDIVEVICTALHSETMEEFVLYKHITGKRAGEENYWVRPKVIFLQSVEKDGKMVSRFEYIGE